MSTPRYQWQPTTAEIAKIAGIDDSEVIRFDHNTSPFPSDWLPELIAEPARHLNEYPGADYRPIREAAAAAVGVPADHVVAGAGIDELILLAARAFLSPESAAVGATPTYTLYRIATAQVGARFVSIDRRPPDFVFPLDRVVDAARRAEIVWLCEPNNPTGDRLSAGDLGAVIAATDGVVVIDAAYAEFAGDRWGPTVLDHHNLLVMHTMSKAYGLAGARVGYAVGHPDLVNAIDRVRPPGSIASLSVDAAVAALAMPDRLAATVAAISASRDDLARRLEELRFRVLPSATNFVLCEVGPEAKALAEATLSEGMVLRTYSDDGPLAGYLRFTARDEGAHDRLIDCLRRNVT